MAMALDIPAALSGILTQAYTVGVEASIEKLAEAMGLSDAPKLEAAASVLTILDQFSLELVPALSLGEYDSTRVLRPRTRSLDRVGEVKRLLEQGEGMRVEYKGSMLCSMRDWSKDESLVEFPSLPGELLKTVCAFLNTEGGDLLVGVDDDGLPCKGISLDMKLRGWNEDAWQLHFQSLIADRFHEGTGVKPYVRGDMVETDGERVFHVSVMPRTAPSFVRREKGKSAEFFVRNGPRTDSLDLPGFAAHLEARLIQNLG